MDSTTQILENKNDHKFSFHKLNEPYIQTTYASLVWPQFLSRFLIWLCWNESSKFIANAQMSTNFSSHNQIKLNTYHENEFAIWNQAYIKISVVS